MNAYVYGDVQMGVRFCPHCGREIKRYLASGATAICDNCKHATIVLEDKEIEHKKETTEWKRDGK